MDMALQKQSVLLRIKAAGDVLCKLGQRTAAKFGGILAHGECVQIRHEVVAIKFIGKCAPVFHRAEVVSKVQVAGGLDSRKHYLLCCVFHFILTFLVFCLF